MVMIPLNITLKFQSVDVQKIMVKNILHTTIHRSFEVTSQKLLHTLREAVVPRLSLWEVKFEVVTFNLKLSFPCDHQMVCDNKRDLKDLV